MNYFLKKYANQIQFYSSHRVKHNSENRILNEYHMIEINYFKVLLLCKMMWNICWTDTDVA
jgi:hypothetical protein